MKEKNIFRNIIHFLVHNSFLFTVIIMCLVHAVLLMLDLYAGVTPLVLFNIVSVIIYMFCILLCRIGQILPVYVSILLEVCIYAVVSVYYTGWDCGSFYFLFSIVPIIIYFGTFIFKDKKRWIVTASLVLDFLVFAVMFARFSNRDPVFEVSRPLGMTFTLFSSFVMFFSIIFYNTIYIHSSENEVISLEHKNEQLSADANSDILTHLLNRRGFLPLIKSLMEDGASSHFCIAFLDIDNFKRINDSYGHDCGDEVLRHISKLIRKEMHGCSICRWGGEEIIVLMKDYDMTVARQKMEYVRHSIESTPTVFYNKRIPVTVTIGLEEYNDSYHDPNEIIKAADERMYYGKQHGKNILIYSDETSLPCGM